MIEVILKKEIIDKNCDFILFEKVIGDCKYRPYYIFPNNKEFLKFWKYRKDIIVSSNTLQKNYYRDNISIDDIEIYKDVKKEINKQCNWFRDYHRFVFEFPDEMEEEAFYFKLKYCN